MAFTLKLSVKYDPVSGDLRGILDEAVSLRDDCGWCAIRFGCNHERASSLSTTMTTTSRRYASRRDRRVWFSLRSLLPRGVKRTSIKERSFIDHAMLILRGRICSVRIATRTSEYYF